MRERPSLESSVCLSCLGVATEVAFTAVTAPSGGPRLVGHSYLWMFPIYALLQPAFSSLRPRVSSWSWPARAFLGEAPWEQSYRGHRWCVLGPVRLDFFPAWAAASLFFERAYLRLNRPG